MVLGEATGGHGVPGVGVIPELLGVPPLLVCPFSLPVVDGVEFDELEFGVDPVFGVEAPFDVPGRVPHGDDVCPVLPGELPAGADPAAGALCAAIQLAQPNTSDNIMSFPVDI